MNRIFTTALVAMFILAASIPSFAQSAIDINGIKISASGSFGFIGAHKNVGNAEFNGDGFSEVNRLNYSNYDANEVEYVMSLALEKTFSTDGTVFIKIKGGGMTGASSLSLGWFRPGVDDDAYGKEAIEINELSYTQPLLGDLLSIKVGRFGDAGSPNDVASSVGSFFLGDPTIPGARGSGQNPYGVQFDYNLNELLSFEYQYLTQAYTHNYDGDDIVYGVENKSDITRTPYNVLFVNVKPIENGNYRIGYWRDTAKREFANYRQGATPNGSRYIRQGGGGEPQGIFLSFDQQIIENLSAFLRGGYRLDETIGTGPGQAKTSWQLGAKVGGAFWGRANDSFFIAVGQAQAPENIEFFGGPLLKVDGAIGEDMYGKDYEKPKAETHFEINYLIGVNEQVSIVAFGQYVGDIYSFTGEANDKGEIQPTVRPKQDYGYAGGLKLVVAF
jgi:hypothetical protein